MEPVVIQSLVRKQGFLLKTDRIKQFSYKKAIKSFEDESTDTLGKIEILYDATMPSLIVQVSVENDNNKCSATLEMANSSLESELMSEIDELIKKCSLKLKEAKKKKKKMEKLVEDDD